MGGEGEGGPVGGEGEGGRLGLFSSPLPGLFSPLPTLGSSPLVSRVISRVISIICAQSNAAICDFHSPARREGKIQTMRSRKSVSEIGLGEWPAISQNGRRQAPPARLRAHHPCIMVGRAGRRKFWMSTAFSNKKMASPRRHTAFRRTAEFANLACCLPFYVHFQNGGNPQ